MVLVVLAILGGLGVGVLRRGRITNLRHLRVHWWALLLLGVAVPVSIDLLDPPNAVPLLTAGLALTALVLLVNLHISGVGIVIAGVIANLVAVVLNDGVAVSADALVRAGVVDAAVADSVSLGGARHLATPDDRLDLLGNVVPIPALGHVVSIGDLITLLGIAAVVAGATRRRWRPPTTLPDTAVAALMAMRAPAPLAVMVRPDDLRAHATPLDDWLEQNPEHVPMRIDLTGTGRTDVVPIGRPFDTGQRSAAA